MIKIVFAVLLSLTMSNMYAQEGLIHFDKKSNKPFIINNRAYSFKDRDTVFQNTEALKLANSAQGNFIGGQIMAGISGGLLGATLSDFLLSKRENFTDEQWSRKKMLRGVFLGCGGVAFLAIAIPISKSGIKKVERAVEIENQSLSEKSNTTNSFKIECGFNSIALKYNF